MIIIIDCSMHCYYLYKVYGLTEPRLFLHSNPRPNWTDPLELWTGLNIMSFIIRVVFVRRGQRVRTCLTVKQFVLKVSTTIAKFRIQVAEQSRDRRRTVTRPSQFTYVYRDASATMRPGGGTENYPRSWAVGRPALSSLATWFKGVCWITVPLSIRRSPSVGTYMYCDRAPWNRVQHRCARFKFKFQSLQPRSGLAVRLYNWFAGWQLFGQRRLKINFRTVQRGSFSV